MKFSTAEVNKARIYKFTHKYRCVTYGILHWPWYIQWHCAAYRSWYFAVSFGMCLTGFSCLNREEQRGKNEVRTNFFAMFCSGRKKLSAPRLDLCWNTKCLFLPHHYAINQEIVNFRFRQGDFKILHLLWNCWPMSSANRRKFFCSTFWDLTPTCNTLR